MIIDQSYFFGKLNLPQTGNTDGVELVDSFITTYEKEYLQKILCYSLWKAFSEGIDGSGEPSEQRWIDLLEGAEYEWKGKTVKWNGFENSDKLSPIANYVYYRFIEDDAVNTTLVGQSTNNQTNATRVNPVSKMIDSWNRMVEMNKVLFQFLKVNEETYPEFSENCYCDNELMEFKTSLDI